MQTAKKFLAGIRERNRENIRREDLDGWRDYYETYMKKIAEPQEMIQLEKLFNRAENLIEREDLAFEDTIKEIISLSYGIVVRDNDFIIDSFISLTKNPDDYGDKANFQRLAGKNAIAQKNFTELRKVVSGLYSIAGRKEDEFLTANIIKA